MARLRRNYPLIGESITVSLRFGFALVENDRNSRASICVPEVTNDRMTFYLLGWYSTAIEAMEVISSLEAQGISPEEAKEMFDEQAGQATDEQAAQQGGGEQPPAIAAEPYVEPVGPADRALAERLAAAIARASGLAGDVVAGLVSGKADGLGNA